MRIWQSCGRPSRRSAAGMWAAMTFYSMMRNFGSMTMARTLAGGGEHTGRTGFDGGPAHHRDDIVDGDAYGRALARPFRRPTIRPGPTTGCDPPIVKGSPYSRTAGSKASPLGSFITTIGFSPKKPLNKRVSGLISIAVIDRAAGSTEMALMIAYCYSSLVKALAGSGRGIFEFAHVSWRNGSFRRRPGPQMRGKRSGGKLTRQRSRTG
jgi:hypothetical protein